MRFFLKGPYQAVSENIAPTEMMYPAMGHPTKLNAVGRAASGYRLKYGTMRVSTTEGTDTNTTCTL